MVHFQNAAESIIVEAFGMQYDLRGKWACAKCPVEWSEHYLPSKNNYFISVIVTEMELSITGDHRYVPK